MREKIKKTVAVILCIVMCVCMIPDMSAQAITQGDVTSQLNSLINQYANKTATSSQMYMGSQCKGFANWVFKKIFGVYIGPYPESANYKISNAGAQLVGMINPGGLNEASAKALLQKALPGDYIQVQRSIAKSKGKCGPHSMIVVGVRSDGVQVFDCNSDARNTIKTYLYSWSNFDYDNRAMSLYHAYNYEIDTDPVILPGIIDNSWKVPVNINAAQRITTYNDRGKAESNHNIDPGDNCYITEVYTNGFVKVQYPVSGGKQRWAYAKASDFSLEKQFGNPVDLGTNFYAYIINTSAWKHLTNDGCNVSMRSETGAANQVWKFERQGDGSYKIINQKDKLVLDDQNFGQTNGTNVAVCTSNDSTAQRWFIYGSSGAYYLKAKCGNLVLDVNGASKADGTNIQMWEKNDTVAQKFQIWKLNQAGKANFNVAAGTSTTETKFSWNKTSDTTHYVVKIWKNKVWQGSSFKEYETKNTSWSIKLPEGTYEAYVDSNNSFSCTCSNIVRFTIKKGECTHNFGNWTTTKKATCTVDGSEQRKCSLCGKIESRTIKATGHKYTTKVLEPTYTQKGYTLHTCSVCGYSYKDNYRDVKSKQLTSISVTAMPKKTSYYVSDPLDTTGMTVTAYYSDGSKKDVTGWKVSGDTSQAGSKSIRVEYAEGGKTVYTTFDITVKQRKEETITITYYDCNGNMYGASAHYASNQSFNLMKEYPDISCRIQLDPDGGNLSQKSVAVSAPFLGWYTSMGAKGTRYAPGQSVSFNSSINLYAGYGEKTVGTLPQPYKEGYTFKGWYTKEDGKQIFSGSTVSDGCELVARWEKKEIEENEDSHEDLSDYENPDDNEDKDSDIEEQITVGDEITTDESVYTVTKLGDTPCVEYSELFDDEVTQEVIPDTITVDGVTYLVTAVGAKAFYKNTDLKQVTIGKNVSEIGGKAFYGCSSLSKVIIKSDKLKSGSIGSNAFTKVAKNVKVYVPGTKYSTYKKILKKAGIGSKAKIYKKK